jgi:hypothetical protein
MIIDMNRRPEKAPKAGKRKEIAAHKNRKAECPVFSLSAIAEPLKGGFGYL